MTNGDNYLHLRTDIVNNFKTITYIERTKDIEKSKKTFQLTNLKFNQCKKIFGFLLLE